MTTLTMMALAEQLPLDVLDVPEGRLSTLTSLQSGQPGSGRRLNSLRREAGFRHSSADFQCPASSLFQMETVGIQSAP